MRKTKREWIDFFNSLNDDAIIGIKCSTFTKNTKEGKIEELILYI